jgi:lipoate-protein ligase A
VAPQSEAPVAGGAVRWMPPTSLEGTWQMALDELLLDAAVAGGGATRPVLRLYRWSRPTLSLGFHQRRIEPHWWELAREGTIDLVRRPSGGRAVLHAGDLTYALVWPAPGLARLEAYHQACGWLRLAFADLGQPLSFGDRRPAPDGANCFALATAADLVHGDGSKRIGSAQLWRRGHLLQHGSIQLTPPVPLWQRLFGMPPPPLAPLPVGDDELVERLRAAGAACWGELRTLPLTGLEHQAAAERLQRYRVPPDSSSSPELSMPRAT